jgi:hypothetical protein
MHDVKTSLAKVDILGSIMNGMVLLMSGEPLLTNHTAYMIPQCPRILDIWVVVVLVFTNANRIIRIPIEW